MTSNEKEKNSVEDDLKWISYSEELQMSPRDKTIAKVSSNPFVPIGALVTAGILVNGMYNFVKQNKQKQQMMMRYRCLAQGITILVASIGMLFGGKLAK